MLEVTGTEQVIDPASLVKGVDDETPIIEKPAEPDGTASTEQDFKPSAYWDDVSRKYGTEETPFELPEQIKTGKLEEGKTEIDYLIDVIGQKTKGEKPSGLSAETEDLLIQDYLAAKGTDNFNEIDWLKSKTQQVDVLNLPSNKFIEFYLTQTNGVTEENPNGYTKEDITSYIEGKNKIDLDREAVGYKQNYTQYLEDYRKQQTAGNQVKHKEEFETAEKANTTIITDYFTKNKTDRSFYGVEFSESEYTQLENDALGLLKRNPETGINKLTERLQSDDFVLKILPLLLLGEEKFKAKISGMKEDLKTSIEKKLGIVPRDTGGDAAQPDQLDLNQLR